MNLRDVAVELIERHGRSLTLLRESRVPLDTEDPGGEVIHAPGEVSARGVQTAPTRRDKERDSDQDTETRTYIVSPEGIPEGFVPDKIRDRGELWSVESFEEKRPGETLLYYRIGVSR